MPSVKSLAERYEKFKAKTAPDRVGTRFEAAKPVALGRFIDGAAPVVSVRELVRDLLSSLGVPAGDWSLYISFAQYVAARVGGYGDRTLARRILGAKANWVARGADPAVLDKLVSMICGSVPRVGG